jgi:hypothetical protein
MQLQRLARFHLQDTEPSLTPLNATLTKDSMIFTPDTSPMHTIPQKLSIISISEDAVDNKPRTPGNDDKLDNIERFTMVKSRIV